MKRYAPVLLWVGLVLPCWVSAGSIASLEPFASEDVSSAAFETIASVRQDPRRAPPNPTTPERPKGTAITFGGKTHEEILPNPYRFALPPEIVSNAVVELLKELELTLDERESQPRTGLFRTEWYVFSRGIHTKSELLRVAELPESELHNWTHARYRVEIRVNLIESNVTTVTIIAEVEGLAQDVVSSTWIRCRSRGVIENNLLRALRERLEAK
ncbi:MAG: hypothetical protein N2443_07380 [Blastocatellia bacterium]|nr:hypothetical protein [Blastocatellia bacterium]MCX7752678.1 hypothetical protein [Blastocatellia bacterium]MDW8168409.1 hypothetical protein [Acidobacteriota bacterium]MDW8255605.1 hypothetical protein [Acidobacteriota bacterium]